MDALRTFYRSILGPRLLQVFSFAGLGAQSQVYQANSVERLGDNMLRCAVLVYGVAYYCWPIVLPYLYRKGVFDVGNVGAALRVARITGGVLAAAYALRGVGRTMNRDYRQMIKVLIEAEQNPQNFEKQLALLRYDITLHVAPVYFQAERISSSPPPSNSLIYNCITSILFPYSTVLSALASALGRPMMYPGSTGMLNNQLSEVLKLNRQHLISNENGARRTVGTIDGNKIDTMFFDRRPDTDQQNRHTLIIASDGNAAYYEVGGAVACLKTSYSVLGWNHPGFAASTGLPFPSQEQNAVEAVYQYATKELGFTPDNIMLYSWSIGAYAASFLAQSHPEISSVILDATFDDIIPLAVNRMPKAVGWFVNDLVRSNLHLNNVDQINKYDGPLTIVRRSNDEMMMTDGTARSNRGNFLFMSVFKRRFPKLATEVSEQFLWIMLSKSQPTIESAFAGEADLLEGVLSSYTETHGRTFPCNIGADMSDEDRIKMSAFIASHMLQHYPSQHCVSLPPNYITAPWRLP